MLQRKMIPELMDDAAIDPRAHAQALAGLRRLNRASHAAEIIARPILDFARRHKLTRLTLLDVACGGGDVPLGIAQLASQHDITLDLTLCDASPTALAEAGRNAAAQNIPIAALLGHAPDNLPAGPFDIVTNSLFLHHLTRDTATATLAALSARAAQMLVISDLIRSPLGLLVAWSASRLFSRSPIVHFDAPVSVRAAWTPSELAAMARAAGLQNVSITPCWPWRMLLVQEKSHAPASPAPALCTGASG